MCLDALLPFSPGNTAHSQTVSDVKAVFQEDTLLFGLLVSLGLVC